MKYEKRNSWDVVVVLAGLILMGFGLRVNQLGAIGFAEDEVDKVEAVQAYQRRDIFKKVHEVSVNGLTAAEVFAR